MGDPGGTYDEELSRPRERRTVPSPHLFIVLHADRPRSLGSRHALRDVDVVHLGRGEVFASRRTFVNGEVALHLAIPARALSAEHATIFRRGETWLLRDRESRNGTRVRGVEVKEAELRDGDVLEMGRVFFVFRAALETPVDAPEDLTAAEGGHEEIGFRTLLPELAQRHALLRRIASSHLSILLLGPTGSGKEVLAKAIHAASGRSGLFVPVNCGALPANLVESMLFGHVKGSFSGATRDEIGFVRAADRGTLLLDEIGDLAAESQAALLRVLQEKEVVPVGGNRAVRVDVRVIAATHRPLHELSQRGEFRQDLLARLQGYTHVLPPLRERREDIGLMVADALRSSSDHGSSVTLDPKVASALLSYDWPMNVRELRQALEAAILLATNGSVAWGDLPQGELQRMSQLGGAGATAAEGGGGAEASAKPWAPHEEARRDEIIALLQELQGNVTAAAQRLGKAPFQLRRWMKRFGIDPRAFR